VRPVSLGGLLVVFFWGGVTWVVFTFVSLMCLFRLNDDLRLWVVFTFVSLMCLFRLNDDLRLY